MLRNYLQNTAFRVKAAIFAQQLDRKSNFQEFKTLNEDILSQLQFFTLLKFFPAALILQKAI